MGRHCGSVRGMRQASQIYGFPTDHLTLVKPDGRTYKNITACVGSTSILIEDASLPIEVGDVLRRRLPSGIDEQLIVDDPRYCGEFGGLSAHYQVRYHRSGTAAPAGKVTYNVTGTNARVNVSSHDHSINIACTDTPTVFADVLKALQEHASSQLELKEVINALKEMEQAHGTPNFTERYGAFMIQAAAHMTVIAPFLPALAALLR